MIAFAYFAILSLIAVTVTVYDKFASRRKLERVPEKHLILLSALGAAAPMYLTMLIIRHKTLHPKFMLGLPLLIVLQLSAMIFVALR